jgi:hypothetical protein
LFDRRESATTAKSDLANSYSPSGFAPICERSKSSGHHSSG